MTPSHMLHGDQAMQGMAELIGLMRRPQLLSGAWSDETRWLMCYMGIHNCKMASLLADPQQCCSPQVIDATKQPPKSSLDDDNGHLPHVTPPPRTPPSIPTLPPLPPSDSDEPGSAKPPRPPKNVILYNFTF